MLVRWKGGPGDGCEAQGVDLTREAAARPCHESRYPPKILLSSEQVFSWQARWKKNMVDVVHESREGRRRETRQRKYCGEEGRERLSNDLRGRQRTKRQADHERKRTGENLNSRPRMATGGRCSSCLTTARQERQSSRPLRSCPGSAGRTECR